MSILIPASAYQLSTGATPLLISIPHAGLGLLESMQEQLTPEAINLPDTDWRVDELYAWASELGVSLLAANYSRYVVDLNRPADDGRLYASKTSGLFPQQTFHGDSIWLSQAGSGDSREWILQNIWHSYHQKIASELERIKNRHGYAILLDAHSIAPVVPDLFEGVLPDLNLGSYDGRSAAPDLIATAYASLESPDYSRVLDGRFKGGAITREFGRPDQSIHALQLEISQTTYLQAADAWPQLDVSKTAKLRQVLEKLLGSLLEWKN